jgi:hypothetical protein
MSPCVQLTRGRSLRRRLPLRSCGWSVAAALALSVLLTVWSDRAAAQAVASASTAPPTARPLGGGNAADNPGTKINLFSLVPGRGTKVNLGSLAGQEAVPTVTPGWTTGAEVHFYQQLENQGATRGVSNSGAGDPTPEAAGQVAQRRRRAAEYERVDTSYSDGDNNQEVPDVLKGQMRAPMSDMGQMGLRH